MNDNILTKLHFPTLLGILIIILGTGLGVYLVLKEQNLSSLAASTSFPKDIIISNVTNSRVVISWQTDNSVIGLVNYGLQNPDENSALDDRDKTKPTERRLHYVTIENLNPETIYQFKIVSGKITPKDTLEFATAKAGGENGFKPVIGYVGSDREFLKEGIVYLTTAGMADQSALIGQLGNFIIPISQAYQENLAEIFQPKQGIGAKLKVITEEGSAASATFRLDNESEPIGPLKIGADLDLTNTLESGESGRLEPDKLKYDLNSDNILNASDHAIVLDNFGRNPKDKRADLNHDGVVNQKDVDLIQAEIDKLANQ